MRKVVACLLLVTYSSVNMASALNMHYCAEGWMTDFSTMQVMVQNGGHCMACQDNHEKNCCKHPQIKIKISLNQLPSGIYRVSTLSFVHLPQEIHPAIQRDYFCSGPISFPFAHPPPRWLSSNNIRQAFYCIFLI